jgi:Spy/CpxP family protein refolding chaperone
MTARILFAASLLMAVPIVYAQDAPMAPPASSGPSAAAPIVRMHSQRAPMDGGEMRGREMRGHGGGMGLMLPEGTWWRNPELVSRIGLTAEQQKHIDDIFLRSRVELIHMHASLEEEQLLLEPLLNANPLDQTRALAQIGKIADTRAELEKTNAKMLLSIRAVLNADQWTKLQERHRGMREGREMGAPGATRRGYGDRQAPQASPQ